LLDVPSLELLEDQLALPVKDIYFFGRIKERDVGFFYPLEEYFDPFPDFGVVVDGVADLADDLVADGPAVDERSPVVVHPHGVGKHFPEIQVIVHYLIFFHVYLADKFWTSYLYIKNKVNAIVKTAK
jgi:hypothetical protein